MISANGINICLHNGDTVCLLFIIIIIIIIIIVVVVRFPGHVSDYIGSFRRCQT